MIRPVVINITNDIKAVRWRGVAAWCVAWRRDMALCGVAWWCVAWRGGVWRGGVWRGGVWRGSSE